MKIWMKRTVLLVLSQIVGSSVWALEPVDVVGEWHVTSESEIEDGIAIRSNELAVYRDDGTYYSEGSVVIADLDSGERLTTFAGPEAGTWSIENSELQTRTENASVDFFSSVIQAFDREAMDATIQESLDESEVWLLVSDKGKKLTFKANDDEMEIVMTPLRDLPESGRPLMDSLGSYSITELRADPTKRADASDDPAGQRIRRTSLSVLGASGFKAARGLPTFSQRKGVSDRLQSKEAVLDRLTCTFAAVMWVATTENEVPSNALRAIVNNLGSTDKLTTQEREILARDREEAHKQFIDSIGWKMENMWALAWALGFELVPDIDQGQVNADTLRLLSEFVGETLKARRDSPSSISLRPLREVVQLEDIFYCAHNAVRAAHLGELEGVPDGFHPIIDGGVIHEKRHALTWLLSPDAKWDDTDLST